MVDDRFNAEGGFDSFWDLPLRLAPDDIPLQEEIRRWMSSVAYKNEINNTILEDDDVLEVSYNGDARKALTVNNAETGVVFEDVGSFAKGLPCIKVSHKEDDTVTAAFAWAGSFDGDDIRIICPAGSYTLSTEVYPASNGTYLITAQYYATAAQAETQDTIGIDIYVNDSVNPAWYLVNPFDGNREQHQTVKSNMANTVTSLWEVTNAPQEAINVIVEHTRPSGGGYNLTLVWMALNIVKVNVACGLGTDEPVTPPA